MGQRVLITCISRFLGGKLAQRLERAHASVGEENVDRGLLDLRVENPATPASIRFERGRSSHLSLTRQPPQIEWFVATRQSRFASFFTVR